MIETDPHHPECPSCRYGHRVVAPLLDPSDPRYQETLEVSKIRSGFAVEEVLPADQWSVRVVRGECEVFVTEAGIHNLAALEIRPDVGDGTWESFMAQHEVTLVEDGEE